MLSRFVPVLVLALTGAVMAAPAKSVCAVCREGEEPVAATVRHQDHDHYFCSTGCADTFRKEPARFHPEKPEKKMEQPAAHAEDHGSAAPSCPV